MSVVRAVATGVPMALRKLGVEEPTLSMRRLLLASDGMPRSGKTEFGLNQPEPVGVINLDKGGLEGVVDKYIGKKKLYLKPIDIPPLSNRAAYEVILRSARDVLSAFLTGGNVRSILIDTGSDLWDLYRLAEFGHSKPLPLEYTAVNMLFRSMIRDIYNYNVNLVMTHRLKKEYEEKATQKGQKMTEWTGGYERSGFADSGYLIHGNIRHWHNDEGFGLTVIDCRQNMELAGEDFTGDMCNFKTIAQLVFPDSSESDWT